LISETQAAKHANKIIIPMEIDRFIIFASIKRRKKNVAQLGNCLGTEKLAALSVSGRCIRTVDAVRYEGVPR
jgi:hypothetical protein